MSSLISFLAVMLNVVNLYSPAFDHGTMYVGGWRDSKQVVDRIYRNENEFSYPQEVFSIVGMHVNDPTFVRHPVYIDWLFMYYTIANPNEPTTSNKIGFASSVDNGMTWYNHGVIIENGWSPTVILVGNELWLYYFQPPGSVFRARLDINGWQILAIDGLFVTYITLPTHSLFITNLSVAKMSQKWQMLCNSLDLMAIYRFESDDGLHWSYLETLIDGNEYYVLTPEIILLNDTDFSVFFGYGIPSTSLHKWTFRLPR